MSSKGWGMVWILLGLALALVNTVGLQGSLDRGWPFLLVAVGTAMMATGKA